MPDRLSVAIINLENYTHNLHEVAKIVGENVKIMAVIKANAYGHGIEKMGEAAVKAGASYLGVVSLGELKRLRSAGIKSPILILNYIDAGSLAEAIDNDGSITVMDQQIIADLQAAAKGSSRIVNVHIKVDTGMHRAGCDPKEIVPLAKQIIEAPNLRLEGIFTHLAESEALSQNFTHEQLKVFNQCVENLKDAGFSPPLIHCANSAATIAMPETHFTMVRPGLISYGLSPFDSDHEKYKFVANNFKPVMSLRTTVVFVRKLSIGETVGYNRRWTAERPSTVALLPVGYGDGWRRSPHNAGHVLVNGHKVPIIGSVSMDQTVIDVTDIPPVTVGDEAVLIGTQHNKAITADDVAQAYQTINYEVVTALSDRIHRQYT